jgi:hypothetical protein
MKPAWLWLLFGSLLTGAPRSAPVLSPSQQIRFDSLIKEPAGMMSAAPHYVMALVFSPDGDRVAVLVGQHRHERQNLVHLLLFGLSGVGQTPLQADLVDEGIMFAEKMQWSNSGQILFVQLSDRVLLIDPNTAATICESRSLPRKGYLMPGGLIGPDSYVVGDRGEALKRDGWLKRNGWLWFYDLACKPLRENDADARPSSGDTAPAAGLLAMADETTKIVVVHEPDGQAVSIPDGRFLVQVGFLESGGMLCSGTLPQQGNGSLVCWKLDGHTPGVFSRFEVNDGGTAPFATSSEASIVMIPDRGYTYNPFTENTGRRLKRYVIWDAESGATIAMIAPRKQWLPGYTENTPRKVGDSLVFAVSRDGGLVALATVDSIEIFKVPSAPPSGDRKRR